MSREPQWADQPEPRQLLHSVPPGDNEATVESRLHEALLGQLEATIAFADACTFLTSHRLSEQAGELTSLAWSLYAETRSDLRRSRPRG